MKKVLAICLTSLMLLSATSCGEQKVPTPTEVDTRIGRDHNGIR
jgi:predicted small lipoprotein YifL